MPYVGKTMDRKRSQRRQKWRSETWCHTHKRWLAACWADTGCTFCTCAGGAHNHKNGKCPRPMDVKMWGRG